jgi:hypothetical protein
MRAGWRGSGGGAAGRPAWPPGLRAAGTGSGSPACRGQSGRGRRAEGQLDRRVHGLQPSDEVPALPPAEVPGLPPPAGHAFAGGEGGGAGGGRTVRASREGGLPAGDLCCRRPVSQLFSSGGRSGQVALQGAQGTEGSFHRSTSGQGALSDVVLVGRPLVLSHSAPKSGSD